MKKPSYGNLGKKYPYKPRLKAKGRIPWNKGKHGHLSKETLEKMSESHKRQILSEENKDLKRQHEIENHLHCKFIRIKL